MNIETVAANLRTTIASKEIAYNEWRRENNKVGDLVAKMLDINIKELKRILQDVEQCNPYRNADSGLYGPEYIGQ